MILILGVVDDALCIDFYSFLVDYFADGAKDGVLFDVVQVS